MKNLLQFSVAVVASAFLYSFVGSYNRFSAPEQYLFRNATVIDGNGKTPIQADILVTGGRIVSIGQQLSNTDPSTVIDLNGKTIMPTLISTHTHIGTIKDSTISSDNYTRQNILSQLRKYERYGIEQVMVMGSDRPILFSSGLRDSSLNGLLPGARLHSAGYGFTVPGGPPAGSAMDNLFRPTNATEVVNQMNELAQLKPDLVKIWVDDFAGGSRKMDPAIYTAIINEAHKHGLRVAAHVYYLADARRLVAAGIDVFAHSVRDSVIDDDLVRVMKAKKVMYIPTLSLDEYAYIYAQKPAWINDAFFKESLEPGVYEKISSSAYQNEVLHSAAYARNVHAYETALKNVAKLSKAGILIAMGTDSGAQPLRTQGFSEHLELQLLVEAGLTPLEAISAATKNASMLLHIDRDYGTLEKGKVADFLILNGNPATDIKNTRKIEAVYKAGKMVYNLP